MMPGNCQCECANDGECFHEWSTLKDRLTAMAYGSVMSEHCKRCNTLKVVHDIRLENKKK